MMGYPPGCTQADFDRAFGESLSEPPDDDVVQLDCKHWGTEDRAYRIGDKLICSECEDDLQRKLRAGELIPKSDAAAIARVFMAIERQITDAFTEGRDEDAGLMCRIVGRVFYRALGSCSSELGK